MMPSPGYRGLFALAILSALMTIVLGFGGVAATAWVAFSSLSPFIALLVVLAAASIAMWVLTVL